MNCDRVPHLYCGPLERNQKMLPDARDQKYCKRLEAVEGASLGILYGRFAIALQPPANVCLCDLRTSLAAW
jgi:hypothetical protein